MDGWRDEREKYQTTQQFMHTTNNHRLSSTQHNSTQLNPTQQTPTNPHQLCCMYTYEWSTYDFLYYYTLPFFLTSIIQVSFYLDTKRKSSISCRSEYKLYTSCAFIIYFVYFFYHFVVLCWATHIGGVHSVDSEYISQSKQAGGQADIPRVS